jgi:hypothetical protein
VIAAARLKPALRALEAAICVLPAWVIAGNAIGRLRSRGVVDQMTDRAKPAMHHLLE